MIQAVIFDFDGVIADTERLHFDSYLHVLEPKGLGFSYEEYAERYMAFDSFGCLKQRAQDLNHSTDEATLHAWVSEKNSAYERLLESAAPPPLPGAVEAVTLAASRGPVAVCTGAALQDVDSLLASFGIAPLLSALVTADDVKVSKPDPESYALACARLTLEPSACLALEDTPGGLQSARGAGCQTVGLPTTHSEAELAPYADRILPRLEQFATLLS